MKITHKLIDEQDKLLGYLARGKFISEDNVIRDIKNITNAEYSEEKELRFNTELKQKTLLIYNKQYYNKIVKEYDLVRDIQEELETWRVNYNYKILSLTGSRYTGKTVELLKFAYRNYKYVVYFNLLKDIDNVYLYNLMQYKDTTDLTRKIQEYCIETNKIGFTNTEDTILIIDDIQENIGIYNNLKTLVDNLCCHIAVINEPLKMVLSNRYNTNINFYTVKLSQLSFKEFCMALKLEKELSNIVSGSYDNEAIIKAYEIYKQIGGYPLVVKAYKDTKDIEACILFIQHIIYYTMNNIISLTKGYKEELIINNVLKFVVDRLISYDNIVKKSKLENIYRLVNKDSTWIRKKELNRAIAWLVYSGILKSINVNDSNVALYFADCGIANYLLNYYGNTFNKNRIITEIFLINDLDIFEINYFENNNCKMYFNNHKECVISNIDYENYEAKVKDIIDKNKSTCMLYAIQYVT